MASSTHEPSAVTCCILPLVSVKRRSRNLTSLSFIIFRTSPADFGLSAIAVSPVLAPTFGKVGPLRPAVSVRGGLSASVLPCHGGPNPACSDRVGSSLAGADADRFLHRRYEDLPVADAARLGGLLDGLERLRQHLLAEHHFQLYLRKEIDDVLGTPIKLGVALLAAEPLGFNDGYALQADLLQRLFYLVELEGLDDGLDLLHARLHSRPR